MTLAKKLLLGLAIPLPLLAAAVALYPKVLPREKYERDEALRVLGAPGKLIDVGGRKVHYVEAGEGPPVVLVHGFFYHTVLWRETMAALAPHRRCIALDLFGFGYSDRPRAPEEVRYGYDLWAEQVRGFLDALGIARADFIGQSLGAATIAKLAADHPDRVGSVVLIAPAGIPNPLKGDGGPLTLPFVGEFLANIPGTTFGKKVLRDFYLHDPAIATDAYAEEVTRPAAIRGTAAAMLWIMRNVDLGGIEDSVRAFGGLGKRTLVIWGNEDRAIPASNAERYRALVKPEKVVLVERAGHVPNQERPDVVSPAILDFLKPGKGER